MVCGHCKKPSVRLGSGEGAARLVVQTLGIHRAAVAEAGEHVGELLADMAKVASETPVARGLALFFFMDLQTSLDFLE